MVVVDDLAFAEGPRWRQGALWWSDMHGHAVQRLSSSGDVETVCEVPTRPSGLGWLPDGRLLVVSMTDKRVLRLEPDGRLVKHADLSALAPRRCNDMVVDSKGRAYVGNFGFELDGAEPVCGTVLIRVDPDGSADVAAQDLLFPNGAVLTDDGSTLVVAETYGQRLTAFAVAADGALSGRRVWAQLAPDVYPDGICLDAEGAIWVASPTARACLRVREGGAVLARIDTGRRAFACALGGEEHPSLFVCTAASHDPERQRTERNGRIERFAVEIAGAPAS